MTGTPKETGATRNEGAHKAGNGNNIFQLDEMAGMRAGAAYSTAKGPVIEGVHTQVGLMRKPRGTGARPHSHPNEQWNYIVQGTVRAMIDGKESIAGPGTLLYLPANVVHSTVALPDEDVVFFVVKDLSHGIHGIPADGTDSGGHYEEGFAPEE
jgi:quercetin dioxygenase-like cupin family protein